VSRTPWFTGVSVGELMPEVALQEVLSDVCNIQSAISCSSPSLSSHYASVLQYSSTAATRLLEAPEEMYKWQQSVQQQELLVQKRWERSLASNAPTYRQYFPEELSEREQTASYGISHL